MSLTCHRLAGCTAYDPGFAIFDAVAKAEVRSSLFKVALSDDPPIYRGATRDGRRALEVLLISRFEGDAGRRLLTEALLRQQISLGNEKVARQLISDGRLQEYTAGQTLIEQGGDDNGLFLIIAGEVKVTINGRFIADRKAGQHVGEMAMIEPAGRRLASVTAASDVVALEVPEAVLSSIADENPRMWRLLACELVERIRQRGAALKAPNPEPKIFIGSSKEGLQVAEALQSGLSHERASVEVWSQDVFKASAGTMESLETKCAEADFAVLVATPDDMAIVRDTEHTVPRDNVIFELGLFFGALGRHRTFLVTPRDTPVKLPSDLLGITPITYRGGVDNISAAVGPACTEIKDLVRKLGPK